MSAVKTARSTSRKEAREQIKAVLLVTTRVTVEADSEAALEQIARDLGDKGLHLDVGGWSREVGCYRTKSIGGAGARQESALERSGCAVVDDRRVGGAPAAGSDQEGVR